jgi:hypothetical protein
VSVERVPMKWTWKVTAAVLVALSALLAAATARAGALTCAGDCDGDARVTIDEVLTMVGVALGSLPLDRCLAADTSGDHTVTVDEILAAIRYVPCGCAGCPTPSPTASETPTALPSATPPATFTPSDTPTLTPVPTVPTPGMILFREGWEKGKVGRYPIVADRPTFVGGDSGAWFVGDTVSSDPEECGVDHNLAEIVQVGGSKQLRLTSTVSGSSCADNIFAGPALVNPPQVRELNIPLGADVFLSFQVSADLQLDQRCNSSRSGRFRHLQNPDLRHPADTGLGRRSRRVYRHYVRCLSADRPESDAASAQPLAGCRSGRDPRALTDRWHRSGSQLRGICDLRRHHGVPGAVGLWSRIWGEVPNQRIGDRS